MKVTIHILNKAKPDNNEQLATKSIYTLASAVVQTIVYPHTIKLWDIYKDIRSIYAYLTAPKADEFNVIFPCGPMVQETMQILFEHLSVQNAFIVYNSSWNLPGGKKISSNVTSYDLNVQLPQPVQPQRAGKDTPEKKGANTFSLLDMLKQDPLLNHTVKQYKFFAPDPFIQIPDKTPPKNTQKNGDIWKNAAHKLPGLIDQAVFDYEIFDDDNNHATQEISCFQM